MILEDGVEINDYDLYTLQVGQIWKFKSAHAGVVQILEVNKMYSPTQYKFKWVYSKHKYLLGKIGTGQYIHFKKYYPKDEYPEYYL